VIAATAARTHDFELMEAEMQMHARGLMKYLLAWILGVPGGLILLWFLFNHVH